MTLLYKANTGIHVTLVEGKSRKEDIVRLLYATISSSAAKEIWRRVGVTSDYHKIINYFDSIFVEIKEMNVFNADSAMIAHKKDIDPSVAADAALIFIYWHIYTSGLDELLDCVGEVIGDEDLKRRFYEEVCKTADAFKRGEIDLPTPDKEKKSVTKEKERVFRWKST